MPLRNIDREGLGHPQESLNHHSYTRNDPVNAADPSGMLMIRGYGFVSWGDTGFASNWDEFDFVDMQIGTLYHFTGTLNYSNYDLQDLETFASQGEISESAEPIYASFLIDPGDGGGGVSGVGSSHALLNPKSRCAKVSSLAVPNTIQQEMMANTGYAVTAIDFAATGDVNGFSIIVNDNINVSIGSGVSLAAGSSVTANFNGQQLGIGAVGGDISLNQAGKSLGGQVSSVVSEDGTITSLQGNATLYGVPIPWTANALEDNLNNNPTVKSGLQALENFLGKCAKKH